MPSQTDRAALMGFAQRRPHRQSRSRATPASRALTVFHWLSLARWPAGVMLLFPGPAKCDGRNVEGRAVT